MQIVANNVPLTTLGGAAATMFTPAVPVTTTSIQLLAPGSVCSFASNAAISTACLVGTLEISFNRLVTNPIVHFVGLGASRTITGDTVTITSSRAVHAITSSVPAGATMTVLPGAVNLQALGGGSSVDLINTQYNGTNCASVTAPATRNAGCGSVRINGTYTVIRLNVSMAGERNVYNSTVANTLGDDGYLVTTTVDEDFGDAPASYDPVEAASHIVSALRLGATVDADNTTVFNNVPAVTPSPNAVAAGADNNGLAGDGADEDGLVTPLPTLHTGLIGQTYTLSPSLAGGTTSGTVCGWIDFNRNGSFDTAEGVCNAIAAGATATTLNWTVPNATTAGRSYVRLRASQGAQLSTATPTGRVDSGEVEDYMIEIKPAVRVIKQLSPTTDPGRFDLSIGGAVFQAAAGHLDTTGYRTLYHNSASGGPDLGVAQDISTTAVVTSVGEAATPATTGSYTSTYSCVNGLGATVASGTGTNVNVTLPASITDAAANGRAQAISCTFTNTAIVLGSITIIQNTVPDNAQDFAFTTSGAGPSNFSLDDAADPTLPNTRSFTGLANGSYSVAQQGPVTGWPLTGLSCTDPNGGTATSLGTRTASITISAGEAVTCTYTNQLAAMSVSKTTPVANISAPGVIPYTIVVANTGSAALTSVNLSDILPNGTTGSTALVSGDSDGDSQLDLGETWTYSASYTATQADIDAGTALVNRVSVTSTQTPAPQTSSATTTITRTPAMSVSKTTPVTSIGAPGSIAYSIVVTNTGNVSLSGIAPVDTLPDGSIATLTLSSGDINVNNVLDVGEAWTYTTSYAVTQAQIDAGTPLVNQVSVTSTQTPTPVTASATTTVSAGPAMSVSKTTTTMAIAAPGVISYRIVVSNTGNVALTNITPVDTLPGGGSATVTLVSGDINVNNVLDVGEAWTYSASYAATQADIDAGSALVNTVSVTAAQITAPVTASASTAVSQSPSLAVVKTTPVQSVSAPTTIPYTIIVRNTGNISLSGLTLADLMPDGSSGVLTLVSGDSDGDNQLDVDEAWMYTTSFAVSAAQISAGGQLVNTVTVSAAQTASAVSASAATLVPGGPPVIAQPVPALNRLMLLVLLTALCGMALQARRRYR